MAKFEQPDTSDKIIRKIGLYPRQVHIQKRSHTMMLSSEKQLVPLSKTFTQPGQFLLLNGM
jgi:hypothetical protein